MQEFSVELCEKSGDPVKLLEAEAALFKAQFQRSLGRLGLELQNQRGDRSKPPLVEIWLRVRGRVDKL